MTQVRLGALACLAMVLVAGCAAIPGGHTGRNKSQQGVYKAQGGYSDMVLVRNTDTETHTVEITIERNDEQIFDHSYQVKHNETVPVFKWSRVNHPSGKRFTVSITADNGPTTKSDFTADRCRGNVLVVFDKAGKMTATYRSC